MKIRLAIAYALLTVGQVTVASNTALADDKVFEIVAIATQGRVVSAQFADFNGDAREDLMLATLEGMPPTETRLIAFYMQNADGTFPAVATRSLQAPSWSAVYDVADVRETPGDELILLRPDSLTIFSVGESPVQRWDLPVAGPSTVAAGTDERGFDRFKIAYHEFGEAPLLLVPQIGALSLLTVDGSLVSQLDVGRRANYFVAKQTGLLAVETDLQLFLDIPKISVGDVDGDGRTDIIAATRHEVRVFLRDDANEYTASADYALPLQMIDIADHARGSGSVVTTTRDINRDGKLDLMLTHAEGSFSDTLTTTYTYINRNGHWNIDEPDDRFASKGTLSSDLLLDVDGNETLELVRIQLKFSVLEMVELLLTRKIDARVEIHQLQEDGRFARKPWSSRKISTAVNFDTFRPKGFMPRAGLDLNADGLMDFITSADGKGLEVYLGGGRKPFARRSAIQRFPSAGVIQFSDFDRDGLADFVLYDPQAFDASVRVGRNAGTLPGRTDVASDR